MKKTNTKNVELIPLPFISGKDPRFPDWIEKNKGNILSQKPSFLKYLRKSKCVAAIPGIERNPFEENRSIGDPPNVLSDGRWVWIQSLAYWVEKVDLSLPEEFVEDVIERNFKSLPVPKIGKEDRPWRSDFYGFFSPN